VGLTLHPAGLRQEPAIRWPRNSRRPPQPQPIAISYVLYLPSYAATAVYQKVIPAPANLGAFLAEVRRYAMGEYAPALAAGAALPADRKAAVAKQLAAYTGLSEDYLLKADLRVNLRQFMAELQRSRGLVTGRLDSRFSGPLPDLLSENAPGDPQSAAVTGAFTAAVNAYLRGELKFETQDRYLLGGGNQGQWNWTREGARGWASTTYVGSDLAQALVANPYLRIEIENGYYDMATPFFATEYTVTHLEGLAPNLRDNITLKYYDAGHMMYLYEPALAELKQNVARFITNPTPATARAAGSN
jgi:carboxypeptidase C (cathepsin A)